MGSDASGCLSSAARVERLVRMAALHNNGLPEASSISAEEEASGDGTNFEGTSFEGDPGGEIGAACVLFSGV